MYDFPNGFANDRERVWTQSGSEYLVSIELVVCIQIDYDVPLEAVKKLKAALSTSGSGLRVLYLWNMGA